MKNIHLLIYLFVAIIALFLLMFFEKVRPVEEGFSISFCPAGWNSYNSDSGDIKCCEGAVSGSECQGVTKCTFGTGTETVPNCIDVQKLYAEEKSKSICPKSLSSYYEAPGKLAGCTSGALNSDMSGPATSSQPFCTIYKSEKENSGKADSCINQKRLDDLECFGKDCHKNIYISPASGTALIQIDFTGTDGIRRSAFEKNSYIEYLKATDPTWNEKIDLDKNINIANVAKAIFVDRSMEIKDAQI
jgi:hypothetical protein